MGRPSGARLLVVAAVVAWCVEAYAQPASEESYQTCPPVDEIITRVIADTVPARDDVTTRLACHFPVGLPFNVTAVRLEANGFDLLNKTERSFQTWRTPGGEEFVSRRVVETERGPVEFRVTVHMQGRRIVRFSAQYLRN